MVNIKRLMDADGTGEYFRRAYDPKYYFTSEGYIWRAGKKGDVKEDLEKARAFINFALEALETNKK